MVSDQPLPDRCGAQVLDKVGLELALGEDTVVTDREIDIIRLTSPSGEITIDAAPNYEDVRQYLWDDYEPGLIAVRGDEIAIDGVNTIDEPGDADGSAGSPPTDLDDVVWIDIADHVTNTTNRMSDLQGFCERYAMNDGNRCYVHQGGGAPKGNTNAMKHGLYAQRTNFYEALDQEDKEFIEAMVNSWIDMSPYDRDNVAILNELYRCAVDQLRAWAGIDETVTDDGEIEGLTKEITIDFDQETGEEITAEGEHPVNMPYSRLDGDVRQKLKEIGVYESPEQQQADATKSLAQKLSGLSGE